MKQQLTMIKILVLIVSAVNSAPTYSENNLNKKDTNPKTINKFNNNNVRDNEVFSLKNTSEGNLEGALENFLSIYYDQYVADSRDREDLTDSDDFNRRSEKNIKTSTDLYDVMLGDQPITAQNSKTLSPYLVNYSTVMNYTAERNLSLTENEAMRIMRNRNKDNWIEVIKSNILKHMGRENTTMPKIEDTRYSSINLTEIIPNILNSSILADQIAEKVRSYYPACESPPQQQQSTDQEQNENIMKLNFNFDYLADEKASHMATASLRLYRLPSENITRPGVQAPDCDYPASSEDDKLLRVTAYWYTRSSRKRKTKPKLCDSKMMLENAQWVELSVRPAAKAWSKGRQLSLGIEVEDQEGNQLRADKYFKGASCTVGTSTPKPIPTMVIDAARKVEYHSVHRIPGRNSTETISSNLSLLPIIDICIVEFPHNSTYHKNMIQNLPIDACNLRKMYEQSQKLAEKERIEHLATLQGILSQPPRHIRHQRQYHDMNKNHQKHNDPRSKILNQRIILTREELEKLDLQKLNISTINR